MKPQPSHPLQQRGAALVVGLIMLALITLTVTTAFTLSSTNLKSVGNMQFRNEAVAAANMAIERVMSNAFYDAPTADEILVDINNDNTNDYTVQVAVPTCIRATPAPSTGVEGECTSIEIDPEADCSAPDPDYNSIWNLQATVRDNVSGTSVRVHQGLRVRLTQEKCDAVCAPAPSVACS